MMTRRPHRIAVLPLLLIVGLALAAAACGDADGPAGAGDDGDQASQEPGGSVTVSQALAGDVDGPVTVTGFLIQQDGATRLCEVSLESMPPQCGGPSLHVEGVTIDEVDGAQTAQGVTWVDGASLTGSVQEGVLQVSS
jgi:hypothetical protein